MASQTNLLCLSCKRHYDSTCPGWVEDITVAGKACKYYIKKDSHDVQQQHL